MDLSLRSRSGPVASMLDTQGTIVSFKADMVHYVALKREEREG